MGFNLMHAHIAESERGRTRPTTLRLRAVVSDTRVSTRRPSSVWTIQPGGGSAAAGLL